MGVKLTDTFLAEVFKVAFRKRDVVEILEKHIPIHFIPAELKSYKLIYRELMTYVTNNSALPTIGYISQQLAYDSVAQEVLSKIINTQMPEVDQVLTMLEKYIKTVRFEELYREVSEEFNDGKSDSAIDRMSEKSQEIANFSIRSETNLYEAVFSGFEDRQEHRMIEHLSGQSLKRKVPFGIDALDDLTWGGSEKGDTDLFLARSGAGKSTWLRWRGISAARRGHTVLHFQCEGSREKALEAYDASWTSLRLKELKYDDISPGIRSRLKKVIVDLGRKGGDIYVYSFPKFGTVSLQDIFSATEEFIKATGKTPDLAILDYLELVDPGDGKRYSTGTDGEKARREQTAKRWKNYCLHFDTRGATATQANDISPNDYNNPAFHLTRHNISGGKGVVDPFSFLFTFNQTTGEYKDGLARIYVDKLREYKAQQVIKFATGYSNGRFYDKSKTEKLGLYNSTETVNADKLE